MKKTAHGFTIVELLIVIVVIAILAAISIVAYSGIQTRARETQILNDLSGIAKQLHLYQAEQGRFPISNAQLAAMNMRPSIPNTNGSRILACYDNTNGSAFGIYVIMESDTSRQYRVTHQSSPERLSPNLTWSSSICASTVAPTASWGSNWVAGWTAP